MIPHKDTIRSNPLALVFVVGAIAVIYIANRFPDEGEVGPGFFPIVIAVGILVFSIVDLLIDDETTLEMSDYEFKPAVIVFVVIIAYVTLMPLLGFLVGTVAFLLIVLYYSGVRSKAAILLMSLGLPIALFYIFSRFLLIPLPEGVIPFSRLLPTLPLGVIV